jgi:hypothetical protein
MAHLYRLLGKEYEPKHRPTWVYSERRQTAISLVTPDDVARTSVSLPSGAASPKKSHPRISRTSLVIGNVSDILAQQDGAQSPGTHVPRRSVSFARNSYNSDGSPFNHYIPNRSHIINNTRQRKVSVVSEENQAEDETVQEQRSTAVTSRLHTKSHDSDEEAQGPNREPYQGYTDRSEDSAFEFAGGLILSAPTGQNLRLSERVEDIPATATDADSDTEAGGQSCA